jgi:hypothetical protein
MVTSISSMRSESCLILQRSSPTDYQSSSSHSLASTIALVPKELEKKLMVASPA